MKKAIENFTIPYLTETEQADICFVKAIELFNCGQEDLAAKIMMRALSFNTDYEDYEMPIEEIGA